MRPATEVAAEVELETREGGAGPRLPRPCLRLAGELEAGVGRGGERREEEDGTERWPGNRASGRGDLHGRREVIHFYLTSLLTMHFASSAASSVGDDFGAAQCRTRCKIGFASLCWGQSK